MRYQVPGRPAPIHSALLEEPITRSDGLTLPEARLNKPGSKAAQALESHTASVLREPFLMGPRVRPLAVGLTCAASCPDRVLA